MTGATATRSLGQRLGTNDPRHPHPILMPIPGPRKYPAVYPKVYP